jgi:8-hydroxy-5-deazaflavin:NADPH oxidoreductase
MKVSIIGAGNMGRGIGTRVVAGGNVETWDNLATQPGISAAEELAGKLPSGTPAVKAFNTTFSGTLVAGEVDGQKLDVFIAGDDESAKAKVAEFVEAGGLRAIDCGPLKRAQELEHMGFLHIGLQEPLGTGFGSAIKLHP